jgi:hypothetical protein
MQLLKDRKSSREFSSQKLPLQLLSNLLWAASGVNRPESGRRTAPTAANWQKIDIYVATADGLYLYDAKSHLLKPILAEDIRASTGRQPFVKDAALNLIYVADFSRIARGTNEEKDFFPLPTRVSSLRMFISFVLRKDWPQSSARTLIGQP